MKRPTVEVLAFFCLFGFLLIFSASVSASPGSIDLSFGTAGKVKTDFNSSSDQATASAIYTAGTHAGKIVVAGMVMNASNYDTFGVVRYNANGTLDTSFDSDGKAPTVDLTGYFSRPWGVAIQSDDKIVVAGVASWGSPTNRNDLGVVRYNANGSLDTTFDSDGKVTMQVGLLHSSWQAVAIQPSDGKILIAGQSYNGSDISTIVRLNTNGSYDTSFTASVSSSSSFNAIAVQTDGKIIAAGWAYDGTKSKMVVVRFTSAGALDTSFNATGIQLLNGTKAFGTGGEGANALAIQSDGKILVGGTTDVSGQTAFAVARLNTDGSLDTSFNTTGKVILDPTTGSDYLKGIGVQTDGKIVLSGYGTGPSSGNFDFLAARLNSGGTIDTSFGSSGYVFIDFGDDDRGDAGLVIQSDNNSVIAGWSGSGAARDFALVRLNANSTNMVYASSTVAQNTNVIAPGATGDIVNIAITMNGDLSALTATSFTCNTTGTTAPADISSARLYYTGTTAAFSTATPFGSAVASPSGSFTITGTQTLAEGTNYFWLAYAVAPGATNGNVLDAQCTSVTVGGSARTPSVTAPAGSRQIFNILAIYDIGTHIPVQSGGPNYVVPGSVASGITATNLTAGPSMTTDTFYTDAGSYLFMNWTTSTSNDAGQYFQARITPDALKQITYNKVAFSVAADNYPSGSPNPYYGPTTIDLRYSTDDFASSNVLIQTLTWTPAADSFQQTLFDVDISAIGTRSGTITFRWYGYKRNAAGDSTSTMGFTNLPAGGQAGASGTGSNIIFKGTVSSTNTAPTFVGSTTTLTVNQNSGATDIRSLLHVSDTDSSQTETWTQSVAPNHGGTLSFSGATAASGSTDIPPGGTITYQPAAGYSGTETFTVQVSDGTATATRQITVTVNPLYTVTYNGNGNTRGSAPVDGSSPYVAGSMVTVLGNTASLVLIGHTFSGWNTVANGSGTSYSPGATFAIAGNTTLYAKWTGTVTYDGNGNTSGTAPTDATAYLSGATVTAATNSGGLARTGYNFSGWNTLADGTGTTYAAGSGTFAMAGDITLYARWTASVTYNGNSNTGGSAPTDSSAYLGGATVTVLGNTGSLTRTGYTFGGWNTQANGTGTSYAAADTFTISGNITLYAKWTATVTYNGNGNTGGAVPVDGSSPYLAGSTVTVLGNTGVLVKTGYTFNGWNTAANGSGTSYAPGATFAIAGNTTLYAQWLGIPVATAATSITFTGFTAKWNSATGATGYYLDVATDNGFSSMVSGYSDLDVGNVTSSAVTGLSASTPYYYRLRAYNTFGASDNSNTITISTATTRVVTNNSDNDPGSLRQIIASANPGDEITFAANVTGVIALLTGELAINKDLTISGPGAGILNISGNNSSRIFNITGTAVTIKDLTISNGRAPLAGLNAYGGGMYINNVSPTLSNITFSWNIAAGAGVDIGNSGYGHGGGIYMNGGSPMLTNVTFSNNRATGGSAGPIFGGFAGAANGGGIFIAGGSPTLSNITFIGNSAMGGSGVGNPGSGGGIYSTGGSPMLINITFSGNIATTSSGTSYAGGMGIGIGSATITNSIFWGDTASSGPEIHGNATVNYSVIAGGCPAGSTCSNLILTDPHLGPLADNGGPTQTMALLPGSSAINAGNDSVCAASPVNGLDQRGIIRPQGLHCDIGAYEFVPGTTTAVTSSLNPSVYNQSVTFTATVSDSEPASVPTGVVTFKDGGVDIVGCVGVTLTSGAAGCTLSTLSGGSHTITAEYTSDSSFSGSISDALTQTVDPADQATLRAVAGSPLTYNTSEPLTTTGGNGTGAISYEVTSGSCTLTGAVSDQLRADSGIGTCSVRATKAADTNYNAATSAEVVVTLQRADQTALVLSAGTPLTYNTTETLSTTGGSGAGVVSYQTTGSCTITNDQLKATSGTGTCSVTATKALDDNYKEATSPAVVVTLQKVSQAALTLNAGSPLGYNATETLSTTGGSGSGTVSYQVTLGSCSITGAGLDQLTADSGTGTCSVIATKASDGNYAEATASATVALQQASTTTILEAAVTFSLPNPTVTLTATVSSVSGATPTGTVAFTANAGGIPGCWAVSVVSGVATCITTSLAPGRYDMTAVYGGDANYLGSASDTLQVSTFLGKMARNSWYLSPEGWIVRAFTKADAPNEVYLEVVDTVNKPVTQSIAGMTDNPMLIASDAVAPEVSLGFDSITRTAHVVYTSAGGRQIVNVARIRKAQIGTTPEPLAFGTVKAGSSIKRLLTVSNTGSAPLQLISIGTPDAPFSLAPTGTTCAAGSTLAAGESCSIAVRFTPTAVAVYNGSFVISSDGGDATVHLSGTGGL